MWLQAKKKGVSIMIGYVLLVTCAIVIGVFVYQWIITYVPADALDCPDEVSIFIKDYTYDCDDSRLDLILKNNGLFNIAGYFIHATNDSNQTLAIIDLSNYTNLGKNKGGTVLFGTSSENSFEPNDERTNIFDLSDSDIGQIYSIEIIPMRFQEEEGKMRFVSCGGSRVKEEVSCWVACVVDESCKDITCVGSTCTDECENIYEGTLVPDDCGTRECGPAPNGCGSSDECGTCTIAGEVCDVIEGTCNACSPVCSSCDSETCDDETCIEDTCNTICGGTKAPDCGTRVCGPAPNGCGDENACGTCEGTCVEGECIISSCNGVWDGVDEDADVECDGPPPIANCVDCVCTSPYVSDNSGGCILPLTFGCEDYCILFEGIDFGFCAANSGQCTSQGGTLYPEGDVHCSLGSLCCCAPLP